jgi:hypothetical protein
MSSAYALSGILGSSGFSLPLPIVATALRRLFHYGEDALRYFGRPREMGNAA